MDHTFRDAVESTVDIKHGFKSGLTALGKNSKKIFPEDSRKLQGSVDIDSETRDVYPNESRWDYCLGYNDKAYFVEVHPGNEVSVVLKKLEWLKKWLHDSAPKLNAIKAENAFHWVTSGNVALIHGSSQYRAAVSKHLLPKTKLVLK